VPPGGALRRKISANRTDVNCSAAIFREDWRRPGVRGELMTNDAKLGLLVGVVGVVLSAVVPVRGPQASPADAAPAPQVVPSHQQAAAVPPTPTAPPPRPTVCTVEPPSAAPQPLPVALPAIPVAHSAPAPAAVPVSRRTAE
jgi:hypothetical protein